MKYIFTLLSLMLTLDLMAQTDSVYTHSYLDKSTRFAWLTYGGDLNFLNGGTSQLLVNRSKQSVDFGSTITPRLTIGGIHFWGHADFYVTFPLSFMTLQSVPQGLDEFEVYQGVETGMRLYPMKLTRQAVRPFVGISFRRFRFSQEQENATNENGVPNYGQFIHPIQFGLTYTSDQWHISASGYYNYQNEFNYYISPTEQGRVSLDPVSFNISLLRYVDSDRHMRTKPVVGQINRDYKLLKEKGLLSSWFWGLGPSAALQISKSAYLGENFPFLYDNFSVAILPDVSFGRYFNRLDANVNLTFRSYSDRFEGFNTEIRTRRHSIGVESVKFLFNYLGFVPFVGLAVSHESLKTTVDRVDHFRNVVAMGVTFGWDIRVTKTGSSLLRT
ncbi:MAG: hypothetical protein AAFO69_11105, partial [Bacteroidota bacterium]